MSNTYERAAPQQLAWLNSLPSQNFGEFFFTVKHPGFFGRTKEHRERAIGQLCDGTSRSSSICRQMFHDFPNHGKGCVYLSWRAVPDSPDRCKHILADVIANPKPFDGLPEGQGQSWYSFK